jgi:hypothetical protein
MGMDDDGSVLLRFGNGAKGVLHASQRGMTFIELTVAASASDVKWHSFEQHQLAERLGYND